MLCGREMFHQPKDATTEILLQVVVIVQMLLKINFFLKIFDKFGLLVSLVTTCFKDIIPFVIYLLIWLMSFVMLYNKIGIHAPLRKGLKERSFTGLLIYVWQNSIGNIEDPDPVSFENDPTNTQIYLIWTVWLLNQFIVIIILLNFLIAVIS